MPRFLPALRRSQRPVRIEAPVPAGFTAEQKVVLQSYYDTLAAAGVGYGGEREGRWDPQQAVFYGYHRVVYVFKAVEAIASASSRLPFRLKADEDVLDDHPLYKMLNHGMANPLESGRHFRKRLSAQVLLSRRGAFVECTNSIGGTPVRYDLLPPSRTRPVPGSGAELISHYEVTQRNGDVRQIDPQKVRWVRNPDPLDPFCAVTPLDPARMSVELDFFARLYNVQFMRNDGRPGGVLGVEADMEDEDMDRIESRFGKGPVEAGKLSVVSGKLTYVDTAKTPRDSSYQVASKNARDEIVVAFGVPLSQMGDASGKTFANADAEAYMFWTLTMSDHNDLIASAFDQDSEEDLTGFLDTDGVEVLQRAKIARREEMRTEVENGLRSIWSYAQEADIDIDETPQTRALWIPAGKTPVASREQDQDALGQQPPAAGGAPGGGAPGGGAPGGGAPGGGDGSGGGGTPGAPGTPDGTPAATDGVPDATVVPMFKGARPYLAIEHKAGAAPSARTSGPPTEEFDGVERKVGAALDALAARQAEVVAARLGSPKARKGTKHWAPTGPGDTRLGTKALNGKKIVDPARWGVEAEKVLRPIVDEGTEAVAAGMVDDLGLDDVEGKARRMADDVREAAAKAAAEALWVARTSIVKHSDRLAEIIQDNEDKGADVEQIVAAVRAYAGQFRRGWSQVVATQVAQVVVEGTRVRIGNLPRNKRDIQRTWITRKDAKVRPSHRAAHGQKRRAGQPFTVGGATVRYPGDPLAPHEEAMNCRCRVMFTSRKTARIIPTPKGELARKVLTWAPIPGPRVRPVLAVVGVDGKVMRHVRTPAGAARYGQPVGSIITRDQLTRHSWERFRQSSVAVIGDVELTVHDDAHDGHGFSWFATTGTEGEGINGEAATAQAAKAAAEKAATELAHQVAAARKRREEWKPTTAVWLDPDNLAVGGLSPAEQKALRDYQVVGYHDVNEHLRTGQKPEYKDTRATIAALDAAMTRSTTGAPMQVYRGMYDRPDGLTVGAEFTDAGYGSTSTNEDYVRRIFAEGDQAVVIAIAVPEGTPAVEMRSAQGLGSFAQEDEVLLGRGTRYRVLSEEPGGKDQPTVLRVEVVPGE